MKRKNSVLICSFPKAGTYLIADLLEKLGYENTHWHINKKNWQDYSTATIAEMRSEPERFTKFEDAVHVVERINTGQFAASHLGIINKSICSEFKILVVVRNIKDTLPSWCRWIYKTDRWSNSSGWKDEDIVTRRFKGFFREFEHMLVDQYRGVYEWIKQGHDFIRYEDIVGANGKQNQIKAINIIKNTLEEVSKYDVSSCLEQSLGSETKTSLSHSGENIDYPAYWSFSTRLVYYKSGLHDINSDLGYEKKLKYVIYPIQFGDYLVKLWAQGSRCLLKKMRSLKSEIKK